MKSRRRRRHNKGLTMLLGAIVAVFAILLVVVGIKAAIGGLSSNKKDKKEKEKKEETVLVTGIELACDRAVVRAGEPIALKATVTPENATDKSISWSVPEGMGTVDGEGNYTPSAEAGKSNVVVTAKAKDGSEVSATISVRVLEAIDPTKPMVAITYDDGPSDETTPTVLDALEKHFGVATFFMQGCNIEGKEEILKRSYAMGNELANHSWNHPQLTKISSDEVKKQLEDTDALIKAACPEIENPILRPPYGAFNDTVKSVVGKPIILWSLDTLDWKTRSTSATYESCMQAKDGDIILMHDIHASTVAAAEDIITGLQEKGFQLVTVTELYQYRKGDYEPGTAHYSMPVEEYNAIIAKETEATAPEGVETSEETEETTTEATTSEEE